MWQMTKIFKLKGSEYMLSTKNLYAMNIHYRYYSLEYFFAEASKNGFQNAEIWLVLSTF